MMTVKNLIDNLKLCLENKYINEDDVVVLLVHTDNGQIPHILTSLVMPKISLIKVKDDILKPKTTSMAVCAPFGITFENSTIFPINKSGINVNTIMIEE